MALSACLLGLTELVMELRLNKRVITFPRAQPHFSFIYRNRGGESIHPAGRERWRRRACHP